MILAYPGLLVSGLSFTQFTKHYAHLETQLLKKSSADLVDQLRTVVVISAQGVGIQVKPAEVRIVPKSNMKYGTDPDYINENSVWYGHENSKEQEENLSEFSDWT